MNPIEFSSKTLCLFSADKHQRIDLSALPDEVFDALIHAWWGTKTCRVGSPFTGYYVYRQDLYAQMSDELERTYGAAFPQIRRVRAFLRGLKDGDLFWCVSEDAPTLNKRLAILQANAQKTNPGDGEQRIRAIDSSFILSWGALSYGYNHYAFGFAQYDEAVGETDRSKRTCRFCGKSVPDTTFRKESHAISEGLGNKTLICNEECDTCNGRLAKVENNLMRYFDVRRAMHGIKSKTSGTIPNIEGKGFVIRDKDNNPQLYIERESLPDGVDGQSPFYLKLETNEEVTHQGIYKALCKIVIDLLPREELHHFSQTIKWIKGFIIDTETPDYYVSYDNDVVLQPTVEFFLSKKPGEEPYCSVILHLFDTYLVYILPHVDVDGGQFKDDQVVAVHLKKFSQALQVKKWTREDTKEYPRVVPWVNWRVNPSADNVHILPKSDPVFVRYEKPSEERDEVVFPEFTGAGIHPRSLRGFKFIREHKDHISLQQLTDVSVTAELFRCLLDPENSVLSFSCAFRLRDSTDTIPFFRFCFGMDFRLDDFSRHVSIGDDTFCFDFNLRDYLVNTAFQAAQWEFTRTNRYPDLIGFSLIKTIEDERMMRLMEYLVPVGYGQFWIISDSKLHPLR